MYIPRNTPIYEFASYSWYFDSVSLCICLYVCAVESYIPNIQILPHRSFDWSLFSWNLQLYSLDRAKRHSHSNRREKGIRHSHSYLSSSNYACKKCTKVNIQHTTHNRNTAWIIYIGEIIVETQSLRASSYIWTSVVFRQFRQSERK